MPRPVRRLLTWIAFLLVSLPLYAARVKDGGSSGNGAGQVSLCPDSNAFPFFAVLDGTQSPPPGCIGENDPNQPNPPATYPNRVVVLSGNGFTVTVTPALWENGGSPGFSKRTVFQVAFSGQAGMTLQSLVIGSQVNNPSYLVCDGIDIVECVSSPVLTNSTSFLPIPIEPSGIALADTTTARWDFSQFTGGNQLILLVDGFPSEFATIDAFPESNTLAPSSFAASNFLAVVKDSSNNTLTAGGLVLNAAPAATNDLFSNAKTITSSPFVDFVDTSAAEPQEILSGSGAGGQSNPQGDPIPQDPNPVDAGTPCSGSWPSGSNRVFRSVWYKFTAIASGSVTISTDGSRYDTGVYVFTGTEASPVTVACNDDGINSSGFIIQSSDVTFTAASGQTYYVMVSEVPPPVGVDASNNPVAAPLANDATLRFSLKGGVLGSSANPVPFVDIVKPVAAAPGTSLTQLVISGAGFATGATVQFNGSNLTPATVSANQVVVNSVAVPSKTATLPVTVTNLNTSPEVGTSNVVFFPVSKATTAVTLGRTDANNGGGFSPVAADFNGDGKLDIASAAEGNNIVRVLIGNGDGTFKPRMQYATGTQPIALVQGDFNGDGHLDLAVANEGGGTGGSVSVLLGNGDGTFQTHVEYAAGNTPNAIVTGDFNGDGNLDLAVANSGSSNVSILLGNGDGTFQTHVDYTLGSQPSWVAAGDFNGDGKLDLALAGGSVVSVLLGNGDGTFKSAVTYPGSSPVWVATGDFNRDGKLDLATANGAANTVSVFLGKGDGTFQPRVDYAIGFLANSLAVQDLNADGKLDLVTGTTGSNVSVLLGKGDGTFQSAVNYASGTSNGALVVGDFNGDGRLDVVASTTTGDSIMLQIPTATLNGGKLTFGTQVVGTTSAAQTMKLTNKGSAQLVISKVTVTGDFQQTNTCGGGIAPGMSCILTVTFTPTAQGSRTGTITITDNAQPKTQTISLSGTGTVVKLSAASLSFGSVTVGTKSTPKSVTLTNVGTTSLSITSISITGTNPGDFSQTNTCGTGIAAGANCTISVTFKPTATGARSASVSITDNGGGSPQKISLSGTGT